MDVPIVENQALTRSVGAEKDFSQFRWEERGYQLRPLNEDAEWHQAEVLRLQHQSRKSRHMSPMVLVQRHRWQGEVFGLFSKKNELLCCFSIGHIGHGSQTETLYKAQDFISLTGEKIEVTQFFKASDLLFSQIEKPLLKSISQFCEEFSVTQVACLAPLYGVDLSELATLYRLMALEKRISKKFFCLPQEAVRVPDLYNALRSLRPSASQSKSTILERQSDRVQALFSWGAQIGGEPAYDSDLKQNCFLLILDASELAKISQQRSSKKLKSVS